MIKVIFIKVKDGVVSLLDYYVVGIKHIDKIELFVINLKDIEGDRLEKTKELDIVTEKRKL